MPTIKGNAAIIVALQARGETKVETRSGRFDVYTRKYRGQRTHGQLMLAPTSNFWLVSKRGPALRVSSDGTVDRSVPAAKDIRAALIAEGQAYSKGVE
ncbi:MAG: hypothetical protein K2Q20_11420 [Phycisphaerales bacterium]|nr:hypothetical protein [Phycisphaerales bacterium]